MRVTGFDGSANFQLKHEEVTLMIHSNEHIVKHQVGLLNLAAELGNHSKACQVMEFLRNTLYRY